MLTYLAPVSALTQEPPGMPSMGAPGADSSRPCDLGAGPTILMGSIPTDVRSDQSIGVAVMPETPLTLAYLRGIAIAFSKNDPKAAARNRSPQATADAMELAMHQSDLVSVMHVARPNKGRFLCRGLGAGKFLVLVTSARPYRPSAAISNYIKQSNKLEFFAAEAAVLGKPKMVAPGKFYSLGESASAS
jgi:hypothetical protein